MFQQNRENDDGNDAADAVNEDNDRMEPENISMKAAVKSSSMDLTDRFKYKVKSIFEWEITLSSHIS